MSLLNGMISGSQLPWLNFRPKHKSSGSRQDVVSGARICAAALGRLR